jgi:hypothetical protein
VQNVRNAVVGNYLVDGLLVPQISAHELIPGMTDNLLQIVDLPCVSKTIQIHQAFDFRPLQELRNHI